MVKRTDRKKARDILERLIFEMLLATDGRTTDLLEAITGEKMTVSVLRQHRVAEDAIGETGGASGESAYLRESLLIGDNSGFVVSHNIALVFSSHVPPALYEKIANREEGIGSSIRSIGIESYRQVADSGTRKGDEAVDLFRKPLALGFPGLKRPVPYKEYRILFGSAPGIRMLEYFNPETVNHRLSGFTNKS